NVPPSLSATISTADPLGSSPPSSTMFATKSSVRPLSTTRTLPGLPGATGKTSVPVAPTSSAAPSSLDTLCLLRLRTIATAADPAAQPTASAPTAATTGLEPSAVSASPAPPPNVNRNTQNRSDPTGTQPNPRSPPSCAWPPSPWSVSLPPIRNDATSSVTPNATAPR